MGRGQEVSVQNRLEVLFRQGTSTGLSERMLVDQVVEANPSAFEAIVTLHGPMVWSVCRRTLRDPNDADDAFQATFLVLARKAGSIRGRDWLAPWLHSVAVKVAARARRGPAGPQAASLTPSVVVDVSAMNPEEAAETAERAALLHEAIARLPAKYRDPLILFHLEGCSHEETARRLEWPVGTVRGRLSRARDRLRDDLARLGMTSIAAPFGPEPVSPPIVPETLVEQTGRALLHSTCQTIPHALLSSTRAALWAEEVARSSSMSLTKLTLLVATTASLITAGLYAGTLVLAQDPKGLDAPAAGSETAVSKPGVTQDTAELKGKDDTAEAARYERDLEAELEVMDRIVEDEDKLERYEFELDDLKIRITTFRDRLAELSEERNQEAKRLGVNHELVQEIDRSVALLEEGYHQTMSKISKLREDILPTKREVARLKMRLGLTTNDNNSAEILKRLDAIERAIKNLKNVAK